MLIPTVVLGVFALILLTIGYFKGEGAHISGLKAAFGMTLSIFPLLVFAFITAGMIQVLLPQEVIARWVGTESGLRGIAIGSIAGGCAPGVPLSVFLSQPGSYVQERALERWWLS